MLPNLTPAKRRMLAEAAQRALAQRRLLDFCKRVMPNFEAPAHIVLLADYLERLERGDIKRLLLSMPPRHGKSNLARLFAAWWLGRHPDEQCIFASYGQSLAEQSTYAIRELLASAEWPFETRVAPDSKARDLFRTTNGGVVLAAGVDARLTGYGAHLLIADDLVRDYKDATSDAVTEGTADWWKTVAVTRTYSTSKILVCGTRWSSKDLPSTLLDGPNADKWTVLNLSGEAGENDPLGREPGAALWPARFDLPFLHAQKRELGEAHYSALYSGDPVPREGSLFKVDWFSQRYSYDDLPRIAMPTTQQQWPWYAEPVAQTLYTVTAVDGSWAKTLSSDYSVILTVGTDGQRIYVLDVFRARVQLPELTAALLRKYREHKPQAIVVEAAASGDAVVQTLKSTMLPILSVNPHGASKLSRWQSIIPLCESGRVLLPKTAPWLGDFEREIFSAPNGKFDDQCDALALGVSFVARLFAERQQYDDLSDSLRTVSFAP